MMPPTLWRPEDVIWWRAESVGGGLACGHHHRSWDGARRCRDNQQRAFHRRWVVRAQVFDPERGWQSLDPDLLEDGRTVAVLFACSWTHDTFPLALTATWRAPVLGYALQMPGGSTPLALHPASAVRALRPTVARHLRRTTACTHWHHHYPSHPPWTLWLTWFEVAAHAPREWARQYRVMDAAGRELGGTPDRATDWRALGAALAEVAPADVDRVDQRPDGLTIHIRRPAGIPEGGAP